MQSKKSAFHALFSWSGRQDSNLRPQRPKRRALPTAPLPVIPYEHQILYLIFGKKARVTYYRSMSKRTLLIILLICLLILLTLGGILWWRIASTNQTVVSTPIPVATSTPSPAATNKSATPTPESGTILPTVLLQVPFTIQAPTGNWDEEHGETCEEASILMASYFATDKQGEKGEGYNNRIPPSIAETELQKLIDWENATFGDYKDTTSAQTKQMGEQALGMQDIVLYTNATTQMMKQELSKGRVVVAPMAGRLLNNPNFRGSGPPYHMILIKGYDERGFITNDPGTRKGESYIYSETTIANALHDWTGSTSTITNGAKVFLSIGKQ